jgi:ethanolamine transporter EutH
VSGEEVGAEALQVQDDLVGLAAAIGAYLGLAAAWVLGLDVIHAALGVNDKSAVHLGLAATGVVIGLGSVPLHELIGGLVAFKNSQGSR